MGPSGVSTNRHLGRTFCLFVICSRMAWVRGWSRTNQLDYPTSCDLEAHGSEQCYFSHFPSWSSVSRSNPSDAVPHLCDLEPTVCTERKGDTMTDVRHQHSLDRAM